MNTKALPKVSTDQTNQQFRNVIQQITLSLYLRVQDFSVLFPCNLMVSSMLCLSRKSRRIRTGGGCKRFICEELKL